VAGLYLFVVVVFEILLGALWGWHRMADLL